MKNTFKRKKCRVLWILCAAGILFCMCLSGCEKEEKSSVGFQYDDSGNPNLIHHLTNGYDECTAEGLSAIEFRAGVPNDNSLVRFGNSVDDEVLVTETDVIARIMSDFDQIFVEVKDEEIGIYDSVIEFTLYPKDDCDIERIRIKRNVEENSYIVQSFSGGGSWGVVVGGKEFCEDLFAVCEEYGVEVISFIPEIVEVHTPKLYMWNDTVASDIHTVTFLFGQTIEDQESIEKIVSDLSQIVCIQETVEEYRNSPRPNISIAMDIIGHRPEHTYSLRLAKNTEHELYWIEKTVDHGSWEETAEYKVVEGMDAFEDLWLFYSGCQDKYLNIVR